MAYPGEDYKMSNYGYKWYDPEQVKENWRENVAREFKIAKHHATTEPCSKVSNVHLTPSLCWYHFTIYNTQLM